MYILGHINPELAFRRALVLAGMILQLKMSLYILFVLFRCLFFMMMDH